MSPRFVVFSLPRSRSLWLSKFLSYGGRAVGHDLGSEVSSLGDFVERFNAMDGTCETGAAFAWPLFRRYWPDLRFLVVRRSPKEVCESLRKFGLEGYLPEMKRRWGQMKEISALRGTFTVEYSHLVRFPTCIKVFEACYDEIPPYDWWDRLDRTNIQINMGERLLSLAKNQSNIAAMKAEIASKMMNELHR